MTSERSGEMVQALNFRRKIRYFREKVEEIEGYGVKHSDNMIRNDLHRTLLDLRMIWRAPTSDKTKIAEQNCKSELW